MSDDGNPGSGSSISSFITIQGDNYYRSVSPTNAMISIRGVASGSWGISITGSARALDSSHFIERTGGSNLNTDFQNTPAGSTRLMGDHASLTNSPGGTWWFYQNMRHSNSSSFWGTQVAWGWEDNQNRLATRNVQGGSYGGWVYYLNSANFNSYSPTLTGGNASGTWAIAITGNAGNASSISNAVGSSYTWTGVQNFQTNNGTSAVNNSSAPVLQAYSTGGNSAFMAFHRAGSYAVNFGLDGDNVMRIGGWSAGANRWQLDTSNGNMTVAGDVTAFSDGRIKENVITIDNALQKITNLRGVYYNRTDSDDKRTKIGVIAQEILEVLPEVVSQDNAGMYNVSYGNITAVLIEAIKEQQEQINELKELVQKLINK
jgi:hypothetical protein